MKILLLILFGYLIGSIPYGYIAGKIKGIDVTRIMSRVGAIRTTKFKTKTLLNLILFDRANKV
ncbi:glycerol-3-phosphate acyltransferase [candidate division WOR-3 bacterium]|nr:glycerol-3-phosphate acyltransferase [candidate division WOR-3 bacterium]